LILHWIKEFTYMENEKTLIRDFDSDLIC